MPWYRKRSRAWERNCTLTRTTDEKGISQKELEKLSGVSQPVIARMERGTTNPQIDTLIKVLAPLGKKLAVVPM